MTFICGDVESPACERADCDVLRGEMTLPLLALGVRDLRESQAFYERLGWQRSTLDAEPFRVLQDATAIRLGLEAIGRDDVTPDDLAETDHFDIGRHEATADLGDA